MKNIDKIRAMSAEELADYLDKNCDNCAYSLNCASQDDRTCYHGIVEWLNQEVNPMPEIKAGDLLFYGKGKESYYVAIAPDKLVTLRGYVIVDLENAIRKDSITTVKRYKDGGLATIWRVKQ